MLAQATIDAVKERTDIAALIGESVRLTRRGPRYVGCCPFHKEKTPSFHVNPERGFYHCFGCKESGDAIGFVTKIEGLNFVEAVRRLAERAGIEIIEGGTEAERREAAAARRAQNDLYAANTLAATFFEACLWGGAACAQHPLAPLALAELERRKLGAGEGKQVTEALAAFRVGYAPASWDALAVFLRQQGASLLAAERVGLLVPRQGHGSGYYDRFRHRLMFPVFDPMGRVVAFSGRALPKTPLDETKGETAKYVNSPESPIYTKGAQLFGLWQGKASIRQLDEAVLVEGNFDVVALHARGVRNVVAPLGTAFTADQARLLKRSATHAVLLFDGDAAGRKATLAARGPCSEAGIAARVATLPAGDPDELVRAQGAAGLERVLREARGMLEYLIDVTLDAGTFRGVPMQEQLARLRAVGDVLGQEQDDELRRMGRAYADHAASQLARAAGTLTVEQLHRIIDRRLLEASSPAPSDAPSRADAVDRSARPTPRNAETQLMDAILGSFVDAPALLADADLLEFVGPLLSGDHALALTFLLRTRGTPEALPLMPPSLRSIVAARLASPLHDHLIDAHGAVLANAQKLRARRSVAREEDLLAALKAAETSGDAQETARLLEELEAMARRKAGRCKGRR